MANHEHYAFLTALASTDSIITPNQRLRVYLEKQYNRLQLEQGKTAWPTLSIYTLQGFLNQLFSTWKIQANSATKLLNAFQAKRLLQEIIQVSPHAQLLFKSKSTSEEVYAAWNLVKQWHLSLTDKEFATAKEYTVFREWVTLYQQYLNKHQQIDEACLIEFFCAKPLVTLFINQTHIHAAGFLEYTPAQQQFWQHLPIAITHHQHLHATSLAIPSKKFEFSTTEEELTSMARWAKQLNAQQPESRIGCIIPQLEPMQDDIKRVFQAVFNEPNAISSQFNISAGQVMSKHTLIQQSIALLKLFIQPFTIDEFKKTVTTLFIGHWQQDKNRRFALHAKLPAWPHRTFNLERLFKLSYFQLPMELPLFYWQLHTFYLGIQEKKKRSYRQWSQWFQQFLQALNWPGDQSLTSYEYQLVSHWISTIDHLHDFDYKHNEISLSRFYKTLLASAQYDVFHPETPDSQIHIVGTLEAIALPFDYTWVSMMNSNLFPAKIKPNAFLPKSLQKQHDLPHATANRELEYNKKLLSHLHAFSKECIYSYALSDNQQPQQQSGFIRQLDKSDLTDLPLADYIEKNRVVFSSKKIENFIDAAVPVSMSEKHIAGSYLFKVQAQCAFKAFNELRLQIKPPLAETPGIEKNVRGSILHDALQIIWQTIKTQSQLKALEEIELNTVLINAIEQAFKKWSGMYEKNYLEIEKKRHLHLIKRWLEIEKNREAFSVVAVEEPFTYKIENRTFHFRYDRIDQLHNDQSQILIDYKNSEYYALSDCFNDIVLHEPQLPLYALALQDRVNGIAFAQITAKELKLSGVAEHAQGDFYALEAYRYSKEKSWYQQLQQWKSQLTQLLLEFEQGAIKALPSKGLYTCNICKQHALCRKFQ